MGLLPTRVADEDVEPAEPAHRIRDQPFAEGFVAQIAGNRDGDAALCLDEFDHLASVRLLIGEIIDGNIRAFSRIGDGGARPMPLSPPVISALRPCRRPEPR